MPHQTAPTNHRPSAKVGVHRQAYLTSLGGTLLATFTYDPSGVPESVVVGADPASCPRYYYVYNGHGDVVALTDESGTVVASYTYDAFGVLTSSSESIPNANGWTAPYPLRREGWGALRRRDGPLLAECARLRSDAGPVPAA